MRMRNDAPGSGPSCVRARMRRLLPVLATALCLLAPSAALAAAGEPVAADRDCLRFVRGIDLQTVTIPQLQKAMNARKLTSVELVDAYLARIKAYDKYNAIRALNPHARELAAVRDAERRAGRSR